MIDFYQGIDTQTQQALPYLKELSQLLDPKKSANDNYREIEQLSQELGSREAFNRLRPDDKKLSEALIEAKRHFLDEASKSSYDKRLDALRPVAKVKERITQEPLVSPVETSFESFPLDDEPTPKAGRHLIDKQKPWLTLLMAFVSFWLLVLIFIYLQWNLIILLILLGIVLILFLLLDN